MGRETQSISGTRGRDKQEFKIKTWKTGPTFICDICTYMKYMCIYYIYMSHICMHINIMVPLICSGDDQILMP